MNGRASGSFLGDDRGSYWALLQYWLHCSFSFFLLFISNSFSNLSPFSCSVCFSQGASQRDGEVVRLPRDTGFNMNAPNRQTRTRTHAPILSVWISLSTVTGFSYLHIHVTSQWERGGGTLVENWVLPSASGFCFLPASCSMGSIESRVSTHNWLNVSFFFSLSLKIDLHLFKTAECEAR